MKDYWAVLGVRPGASLSEIRRAYRRLAWQYHPDRNSGDPSAEAKMREINEAYEVLSDPDRRAQYQREWQEAQWIAVTRYSGSRHWYSTVASDARLLEDLATLLSWITGSGRPTARWPFDRVSDNEWLWQSVVMSASGRQLFSALLDVLFLYDRYRARRRGW